MADGFVGAKLKITISDGSYTGTVHRIDTKKRKLTLSSVVACGTGRKLHGFHHFYGHELDNLELLETQEENTTNSFSEKGKEKIQKTSRREAAEPSQIRQQSQPLPPQERSSLPGVGRGRGLLGRALKDAGVKFAPAPARHRPQNKPVFRDVSDGGQSLLQRSPLVADRYFSDDVGDGGDELADPMDPPELVQITEFGEAFESAVNFIKTQRVVGVSCEGINLGRHGRLCWLVIACRRFVYLFDVLTLGASCFEEGLQHVLESGDILKVIHDCRQVSDALFHQYEVELVNVFDTQVADVIIFKNEKGGELPRHVNGLVACMYEYLNLSPELLHFQKVRKKFMQKKPSVWADRPLSDALLDSIGKHAMYLRELRHAQMERLMAEFIYGVDIYLSVVRDAKFLRDPVTTSQLPPQFKELNRFRYRHRSRRYDDEFNDCFDKPIPEGAQWSQGAWLEGKQFTEELDNEQARARQGSPAEFLQEDVSEKEQIRYENADSTDFTGPTDVGLLGEVNNVPQELVSSQFEGLSVQTELNPSCAEQRSPNASLAAPASVSSAFPRPVKASSQPIFTSSDFPPLSSSDSGSFGSPPTRPSFRTRDTSHADSVSGSPRAHRAISPVIEAAAALPGRGRASALLRNAMTPAARLPAMDRPVEPENYGERSFERGDPG